MTAAQITRNKHNALMLTFGAVMLTIPGIITSHEYLIPAGMMWLASVMSWWRYKAACKINVEGDK
jgi:UPF0716 family protein affecting phage T7 exclusion